MCLLDYTEYPGLNHWALVYDLFDDCRNALGDCWVCVWDVFPEASNTRSGFGQVCSLGTARIIIYAFLE
jgi:hypothetical protein